MVAKYLEQYKRVRRWWTRLESLDRGRVHEVESENYVDEIYAFFLNCYHLKDWIKNDPEVSTTVQQQVEDHINRNRSLKLCADLCNSLKHLVLTKKQRSGEGPAFGKKDYALKLGGGRARIALNYQVDTTGGPVDAFQLASDCVEAWEDFLSARGLC